MQVRAKPAHVWISDNMMRLCQTGTVLLSGDLFLVNQLLFRGMISLWFYSDLFVWCVWTLGGFSFFSCNVKNPRNVIFFSSLSYGVRLKKKSSLWAWIQVCVMKMKPCECFHQASNDVCLHQESQAAQRQILMEFLKEARRNKREVFTPPSLLSISCWYCFSITLFYLVNNFFSNVGCSNWNNCRKSSTSLRRTSSAWR